MTKITQLQENFAQSIVDGLNQTEAYKSAGYSVDNKLPATVYQAASRLAANSKVVARILELKQAVTDILVAKKAWDTERFIGEAEVNLHMARRDGQLSAANAALTTIGKAAGLLDAQPQAAVQITKVTVVLNRRKEDPDTPALEAS